MCVVLGIVSCVKLTVTTQKLFSFVLMFFPLSRNINYLSSLLRICNPISKCLCLCLIRRPRNETILCSIQNRLYMDNSREQSGCMDMGAKGPFIYNNVQFNLKCWSKNNTHIVNFTNKCNKCMPFVVSRVYSIYSITRHIDPDLHCHILCLCGSLLSPGQRLVVVHLVAHRLLPIDGFGLQRERREKRRK